MRPTRNYVACGEHYYWMCVNARALPFILLHTALAHTRTRRDTIYYLYFISLLRAETSSVQSMHKLRSVYPLAHAPFSVKLSWLQNQFNTADMQGMLLFN